MLSVLATLWALVVSLALRPVIALPPSNTYYKSRPTVANRISTRQDEEPDPDDLTSIKNIAAIGDSYSAGIGAGERLGSLFNPLEGSDWRCSRYDHSYPYLLNTDSRLGDPSTRRFEFKSCSGAVIGDIMTKQIPELSGGQQAVLISASFTIGGNDAGLVDILNQCVYQWLTFNKEQAVVGKIESLKETLREGDSTTSKIAAEIDWDKLSKGCSAQLRQTEEFINSNEFEERLKFLLMAAQTKLAPDGIIYYTGYGKFFNAQTSDCDKVTWSTWIRRVYNMFQKDEFLTQDKRKKFNSLVDTVNQKIKKAVEQAGDNVRFVNYDPYIEKLKGRYCEAGVDEAHKESNKRVELMFYKLDSWDTLGSNPWKRDQRTSANGTFEGNVNLLSYISGVADPEASFREQAYIDENNPADLVTVIDGENDTANNAEEAGGISIESFIPDGYGRVFHPQINLHEIISNLIIHDMSNRKLTQMGYESIPEIVTPTRSDCPIKLKCNDDTDCSSPTCVGPGVKMSCARGFCECGARLSPPPTSTTTNEPPASEPTATAEPQLYYPPRSSSGYNIVAWNSEKNDCSTQSEDLYGFFTPWPLEEYLDDGGICSLIVYPANKKEYACFMANMNRSDMYICAYTGLACTGDSLEMRRDDIKELKPGYIRGESGSPVKLLSYMVKKDRC